jgi:hypothetical protein
LSEEVAVIKHPQVLTDLRSLIEFASKQAEKIFRIQGAIHPMYHAIKADGQQIIFNAPDDDKDVSVAITMAAFELENVDRYVFIDEAWVVDTRGTDQDLDMDYVNRYGLRDHPDRREVVTFFAENRRGERMQGTRYILRPERGKPSLSPLKIEDMTGSKSEGRMVGLLRRE